MRARGLSLFILSLLGVFLQFFFGTTASRRIGVRLLASNQPQPRSLPRTGKMAWYMNLF
jgi:hypothetical protein